MANKKEKEAEKEAKKSPFSVFAVGSLLKIKNKKKKKQLEEAGKIKG